MMYMQNAPNNFTPTFVYKEVFFPAKAISTCYTAQVFSKLRMRDVKKSNQVTYFFALSHFKNYTEDN